MYDLWTSLFRFISVWFAICRCWSWNCIGKRSLHFLLECPFFVHYNNLIIVSDHSFHQRRSPFLCQTFFLLGKRKKGGYKDVFSRGVGGGRSNLKYSRFVFDWKLKETRRGRELETKVGSFFFFPRGRGRGLGYVFPSTRPLVLDLFQRMVSVVCALCPLLLPLLALPLPPSAEKESFPAMSFVGDADAALRWWLHGANPLLFGFFDFPCGVNGLGSVYLALAGFFVS